MDTLLYVADFKGEVFISLLNGRSIDIINTLCYFHCAYIEAVLIEKHKSPNVSFDQQ